MHEAPRGLNETLPVAVTVAGSDNSAGAGIQADLKTMTAQRVYGLTVVTCVVSEVPGLVEAVEPMPVALVRSQLELSLRHYPVAAMKTGMLWSREIISAVAGVFAAQSKRPPLVVDPVMVATSGDRLLREDAIAAYVEELFPLATLLTPNTDELAVLWGRQPTTHEMLEEGALELAERYGIAILAKGGHLGGPEAVDILVAPGGSVKTFRAPYVPGIDFHGAGCTFSAAITAALAHGHDLAEAVQEAKTFMRHATHNYLSWPTPGEGNASEGDHPRLIALNQAAWTAPMVGLM